MAPKNPDKELARFWKKVDTSDHPQGCWLWTASTTYGYGLIWWENSIERAHRVSYLIAHGSIPDGLFVLHQCDNRNCVNPDHLFLGTQKENMEDKANKNRSTYGERNTQSKLTEPEIEKIRQEYKSGTILQRELADAYGVGQSEISRIVNEIRWRNRG